MHLQSRTQLRDLYMVGNPAQSRWTGFNDYVIASVPQLEKLDGADITRSMRITAQQSLPRLQVSHCAADQRLMHPVTSRLQFITRLPHPFCSHQRQAELASLAAAAAQASDDLKQASASKAGEETNIS